MFSLCLVESWAIPNLVVIRKPHSGNQGNRDGEKVFGDHIFFFRLRQERNQWCQLMMHLAFYVRMSGFNLMTPHIRFQSPKITETQGFTELRFQCLLRTSVGTCGSGMSWILGPVCFSVKPCILLRLPRWWLYLDRSYCSWLNFDHSDSPLNRTGNRMFSNWIEP